MKPDPGTSPAVAARVRGAGLLLVDCDTQGTLLRHQSEGNDWFARLCLRSPTFAELLVHATEQWLSEESPEAVEIVTGCWLVPLPRIERRRRTGYAVGVILTDAMLTGAGLAVLCRESGQDQATVEQALAELPPVAERDVRRSAFMMQWAVGDGRQLAFDTNAIESIGQQLAESYEEMNLLYSTIKAMSEVDRPARFVREACQELLATLPFTWIGAQIVDDADRVKRLAGQFFVAGHAGAPDEELQALSRRLLREVNPASPWVLDPTGNRDHAGFLPLGQSVLVHPVTRDKSLLGILIAGDKRGDDRAISNIDIKLVGATAASTGIFLENAALYEDLNSMFMGTLEALMAAIDAKDTYTRGHSQRVAHLTQQLAVAFGLEDELTRTLHIAGLVHDVGKIGVPERVLRKPGRLSAEEFDWIKKHPEIGYRILKDIPQLRDILPGVLYHHERFDGKGYPSGLAGHDIPLVARLISLADAFDAMSSDRTYRPAMSRGDALEEINSCAGSQFDPELVPIFVALDFSEYDRLFASHQAGEKESSQESDRAA